MRSRSLLWQISPEKQNNDVLENDLYRKKMIRISQFIEQFNLVFAQKSSLEPWVLISELSVIIEDLQKKLNSDFEIHNGIAIHKTAMIEQGVVIKGPVIISENCIISAHAYLRGPIYLGNAVKIGPGCEIKQSLIFSNSAIAHFNYIGNSIIGSRVNFEAGSICANHYNERQNKSISVYYKQELFQTNTEKFGSLVGDGSKIGANAVLSPGTVLDKNAIVKRLELIDQGGGIIND